MSYAPNGLFENRAGWRKAILAAEKFIYFKDQAHFGQEIWEWVNESIYDLGSKRSFSMRSGADPGDPPPGIGDAQRLFEAINVKLLGQGKAGQSQLSAEQMEHNSQ